MHRGRSTALAHPRSAQRPIGCRRYGDCPDFRAATRSVGPKMGLSPLVDTEIGTNPRSALAASLLCAVLLAGCASLQQWHDNGGEVGPNYRRPRAAVADRWIDAADRDIRSRSGPPACWWSVFDDPALDRLVAAASRQNLTLRVAGLRILEARAQLGIAVSELLPQQQAAVAQYNWNKYSDSAYPFDIFPIKREFDDFSVGMNASWELDFWGRFRRGIEAADASLDAQIDGYDNALVLLQAEVAANYIQMRSLKKRIELTRQNAELAGEDAPLRGASLRQGPGHGPGCATGEGQPGRHAGADPRLRDRLSQGAEPPLHPDGDAAARPAPAIGRQCDHSPGAGGGRRRHSRRSAAAPARRSPRRARGRGAVGADRHGRGGILSPHRHHGDDRLRVRGLLQGLPGGQPGCRHRTGLPLEHPQLRPHPQRGPRPGYPLLPGGGHLPGDRAAGQRRGGERGGLLPPRPGPRRVAGDGRRRQQQGRRPGAAPIREGAGGLRAGAGYPARTWCAQQDEVAQSRGQVAVDLVALYKALAGGWRVRWPGPPRRGPSRRRSACWKTTYSGSSRTLTSPGATSRSRRQPSRLP